MQKETETAYLLKAINSLNREFIVVSTNYKIMAANRYTTDLHGNDIVGKSCHEVYFSRANACDDCPAGKFLSDSHPPTGDLRAEVCGDTRLSFYPICNGTEAEALVLTDFDLPTLGKLETELKRSNAIFKRLILSSVDAVIAADKKGKILVFNEAAAEISGYDIDEALDGMDIRDLYPGDGAKEVMRKLRSDEYGGKGKLISYRIDVFHKNGDRIPISLNAAIVYEGEREVATIGFFRDLRESIRMEKELEKARVQLLQAEKMASLGKLAAGVAHQLNNPLGGITLFTKLVLEEHELPTNARDDLQRILQDAERCRDTVKELLEFARQTRHFMRPHDINKALNRTLFLLENQTLFQNITIVKELADDLPMLVCDIQQLNHIFMNIILNAAQAMDGKGKLSLKTYQVPNSEKVAIEISDTGPGIPEENLPHIFDPFFTTKEEGKGTGLGLSLVYNIVENHGGQITTQSAVGEGTTFTIELPLSGPPEKEQKK
jgi:two-component system NtrC family sensor kinase